MAAIGSRRRSIVHTSLPAARCSHLIALATSPPRRANQMKDAWDDDDDDWEMRSCTASGTRTRSGGGGGQRREEETEEDRRRAAAETHKGAAGGPRQVKAGTLEAKIQAREASHSLMSRTSILGRTTMGLAASST